MNASINTSEPAEVTRYDHASGRTMVTIRQERSSLDFFVATGEKADALFSAFQKVYENVQQTQKD